jgi:hypothetical protein
MSTPVKLDDFLKSQSSGYTATLEPIPEKPTEVKVTPYRDDLGCACSSSFELSRNMIRSVTPTGKYHFCCGKRLEVAVVEFTENASVSVADLMKRIEHPDEHTHAAPPHLPGGNFIPLRAADNRSQLSSGFLGRPLHAADSRSRLGSGLGSGLVGRWPIPGTGCEVVCIEVCTQFCGPTGWDCCQWETRCGLNCGYAIA